MNNLKLDGKTIGLGLLIVIGAVLLLPRLFDTGSTAVPQAGDPIYEQPVDSGAIQVGNPVSATAVDRDGCPTQVTDVFRASEDVYIVAPYSDIPAGTSVFVRLYQNDTPIEDTSEIQADQDYRNTCLNFVFEPIEGPFDAGMYEAEFFVNGNPNQSVNFEIR